MYCEAIHYNMDDPDYTVMDQLNAIKNLINRKAYSLNDNQIYYIHHKFQNLYRQRSQFLEAEGRLLVDRSDNVPKNRVPESEHPRGVGVVESSFANGENIVYSYKQPRASIKPTNVLY